MKRNKNGIAAITIIAVIVIVASVGVAGYFVYTKQVKNGGDTAGMGDCKTQNGLKMCLEVINKTSTYGEPIITKTTITNEGSTAHETSFGCTDTTPSIIANGEIIFVESVCGMAITEVTLQPGETVTYDESIPATKLAAGEYDVQTKWSTGSSGIVHITVNSQSKEEAESKNQACLNNQYSTNCSYIQIIAPIREAPPYTCEELYSIFDSYKMGKPTSNDAPIKNENGICESGIVYYLVPKTDVQKYIDMVKKELKAESVSELQ